MVVRRKSRQMVNWPAHLRAFTSGAGLSAKAWGDELMKWADARNVEVFGSLDAASSYHRNNWPASLALAPSMVDECIEALEALDKEASHGRA